MIKDGDRFLAKLEQKKRILELSEVILRSLPIECLPFEYLFYDVYNVQNLYHTERFLTMLPTYNQN